MPDDLTPAFLVDIDGTLANTDHRMHLLPQGDNSDDPAAWQKFHSQLHLDKPYLRVFDFVKRQAREAKLAPVIITGRPMDFSELSNRWLVNNNLLPHFSIYRRPDNSKVDTEYKADALRRLRHEGYWPVVAIDDQPDILNVWRQHNIKTCYLANKGQVERMQ
jgi:phosphoglycolate phosphatase-like HAD superfamily hydrolase